MFKNLFQFYTLISCFVASLIILIASIFFLGAITNFLIPQYTFYSQYAHFESNESYLLFKKTQYNVEDKEIQEINKLSPSALFEKRSQEKAQFFVNKKGNAIETLIHSLEWIIVSALFFCIHWRLYKKSLRGF
ncbi:MAG: hypothetical protein B7Y25_05875 [Alphaproteobacteria bacterium 16-39-46]|nr:MAG: hypothetical protein B7Y25_05875 [Alphaproteobacteria bacterium 16-39-46]OZA42528.1 MAG: hypothetical protein B7X84_05790 [Alphaproteobacteria bacterium 17-39-52]HQS84401.1 hypothetical protein [Alphaproteobacteria bacterium]HQS94210.1 hypothetical protein [Alphaproteobacteria bacterium]